MNKVKSVTFPEIVSPFIRINYVFSLKKELHSILNAIHFCSILKFICRDNSINISFHLLLLQYYNYVTDCETFRPFSGDIYYALFEITRNGFLLHIFLYSPYFSEDFYKRHSARVQERRERAYIVKINLTPYLVLALLRLPPSVLAG